MVGTAKKVEKLNFEQLGRRFELNAGSIRAAIASAVSEAAMRDGADKTGKFVNLFMSFWFIYSFSYFFIIILLRSSYFNCIFACFLNVYKYFFHISVKQADLMLAGEQEVEKVSIL